MRVLHVISGIDPTGGGTTTAIAGLAAAQQRAGLEVSVLSTWSGTLDDSVARSLQNVGVDVTLVGPATGKFSRHPALAEKLGQAVGAADVVHIAALWEEAQHLAAVTAHSRGVPYIISPHGMLDPWSLAQSRWKKRIYMAWRLRRNLNRAAALHFTAAAERDLTSPLRLKPTAIIEPNGLDLSEFSDPPQRGEFRAKYPQLGNRPAVLFMSRVHPKKGLDLLVPAMAKVVAAAAGRDAMLVIAGPDSTGYRAIVEKAIETHRLSERVIWTGMLRGRDRIAAYVDADLFALPSYQENFAIVVAESLAVGTPVVISDQVNIQREVAQAGVGGVVPLTVDALAEELLRWLGDPAMRAGASVKARAFARAQYDWDQIAPRWGRRYERILGR